MSNTTYAPCMYGIHVCGIDERADEFTTVANYPGMTLALFNELAAEFAIPDDEDPDLVVDFMSDGDIITDFSIRRQSLALIEARVQDAAEATP